MKRNWGTIYRLAAQLRGKTFRFLHEISSCASTAVTLIAGKMCESLSEFQDKIWTREICVKDYKQNSLLVKVPIRIWLSINDPSCIGIFKLLNETPWPRKLSHTGLVQRYSLESSDETIGVRPLCTPCLFTPFWELVRSHLHRNAILTDFSCCWPTFYGKSVLRLRSRRRTAFGQYIGKTVKEVGVYACICLF